MQKKVFLILLLVYLLNSNLSAQETFFKFLEGWRSHKIFERNNSFQIISNTADSNYSSFLNFSEISLDGDSIADWTFAIDTASDTQVYYCNAIDQSEDNIYLSGTMLGKVSNKLYCYVSKFSRDLQTEIWTKPYILKDQATGGFHLTTIKNDTSIILGAYNKYNNNLYTTFLEIDGLGNIRWQKEFHCGGNGCEMKPLHILPTEDNGFIFTCYENYMNGGPSTVALRTAVIKTDSVGEIEWRHTWGGDTTKNSGSWVVPLDDGNFLYAWTDNDFAGWNAQGNPDRTIRFVKFDINGNVIWYKDLSYYFQNKSYIISQMELMPDGNIIIAANAFKEGFLIKIDQEANLIWHRKLMPPGLSLTENTATVQHMKILGVTFTSDGGFILSGEYFSAPGSGSNIFPEGLQSAYAYKLDALGCYEENCNVRVEKVKEETKGFSIYPNPAENELYLEITDVFLRNKEVQICDLTGKLVKVFLFRDSKTSLDIADLEKGIYLVKLGEQIQKLVVE